ncbi:hypothetical protein I350_01381 [Cryptococcus amylolentus CBS 6273]|uniref:Uncharacterized protein n=1 Tax=Cryptococcus amylolentus CBS 6273 TaxID=1296118 RepID=A0A1E3KD48_9TREE|nr:hypothetical protein I350_01381 [Cryptococcus amylolentus CBS 6273]
MAIDTDGSPPNPHSYAGHTRILYRASCNEGIPFWHAQQAWGFLPLGVLPVFEGLKALSEAYLPRLWCLFLLPLGRPRRGLGWLGGDFGSGSEKVTVFAIGDDSAEGGEAEGRAEGLIESVSLSVLLARDGDEAKDEIPLFCFPGVFDRVDGDSDALSEKHIEVGHVVKLGMSKSVNMPGRIRKEAGLGQTRSKETC